MEYEFLFNQSTDRFEGQTIQTSWHSQRKGEQHKVSTCSLLLLGFHIDRLLIPQEFTVYISIFAIDNFRAFSAVNMFTGISFHGFKKCLTMYS